MLVRSRHPVSKMLPLLVPCCVSFFFLSRPSPFRSTGLPSRLAAAKSMNATAPESSSTSYRTSHNVAVCVVPPETSVNAWATVGQIRTQLRDPNYFRWPPHINLLYPFIEPVDDNVIARLALACRQSRCSTFEIAINDFGTFGNKNRGVLWLDPVAPELATLQQSIAQQFPECFDHNNRTKPFRAHMTVSHLESLNAVLLAKTEVKSLLPEEGLRFPVGCIYLLRRVGDGGQFMPIAEVPLAGQPSSTAISLDDPRPFPRMPSVEAEWTRAERMKLKARRNGKGRRRRS